MHLADRILRRFAVAPTDSLLFFGSGRVACPTLKVLHQNFPNLRVVTQSSHRQSKSFNEVENYCVQHGVNWSSPITSKDNREKRAEEWSSFIGTLDRPTFGVVCSYGYMLPSRLIGHFTKGLIVVHPSLLPKYRGGAPIFHAVANGDSVSGVSYIEISKGIFDSGNILHQVEVPISLTDPYDKIEAHLAEEAAKDIAFVLDNIDTLRPGKPQKELENQIQPHLLKAPLNKTKQLSLNMPAEKVFHLSRALMTAKMKFMANNKDIIFKLSNQYNDGDAPVGTFKVVGKKLFVRCSDRFIRVVSWYEPSKSETPPGMFIAQFIKSGKYPTETIRVE